MPTAPLTLDTGHLPGSAPYRRVAVALFVAGIATFALLYSAQPLLPELASRFEVSAGDSTLALSLTTAGLAVALLVSGPLSDAVGRTPLVHASLVGSAVVAALTAIAPTWETFLALRTLQGVALAGLPAVATAYLREELHPSSHARAAGLYIGGTALGGMAGRLVTGPLADLGGWRWAMAGIAAVAAACALAVWLLLPTSEHFTPRPAAPRALLDAGRRALGDPALLALYGIGACAAGGMMSLFNTVGFRLEGDPYGLSLTAASLVFLVYPLGSVSAAVAGRLADRVGRRRVVPWGAAIAVAGVLVTLVPSLPVVVLGLGVLVIGFFVVHGVTSGWVPARAHAGGVPTAQAASLYLVAYYVGSSLFGSLAGHRWSAQGWPGVVVLAVALLVAAGVLSWALARTRPLSEAARPAAP